MHNIYSFVVHTSSEIKPVLDLGTDSLMEKKGINVPENMVQVRWAERLRKLDLKEQYRQTIS